MLSSLRGAAILGGLRGSPPVHLGFVAETIVAVGNLMVAHPEIAELDLNPILAGPDGCVAVDWRIARGNLPGPLGSGPAGQPAALLMQVLDNKFDIEMRVANEIR